MGRIPNCSEREREAEQRNRYSLFRIVHDHLGRNRRSNFWRGFNFNSRQNLNINLQPPQRFSFPVYEAQPQSNVQNVEHGIRVPTPRRSSPGILQSLHGEHGINIPVVGPSVSAIANLRNMRFLPIDPAPIDPAPIDLAPIDLAPIDPARIDPAPLNLDPIDLALIDPAYIDPAPIDLAPIDLAPIDLAPLDPSDIYNFNINVSQHQQDLYYMRNVPQGVDLTLHLQDTDDSDQNDNEE